MMVQAEHHLFHGDPALQGEARRIEQHQAGPQAQHQMPIGGVSTPPTILQTFFSTVVKLTREAPKVVPMQTDTPLNHDERASPASA
jgi:hypothetical protein